MEPCSDGAAFLTNKWQHLAFLVQIVACSSAIFINIAFLVKSRRLVFFHKNCKVLIYLFLANNVVHSAILVVNQSYHLYLVSTASNGCDVLVTGTLCYYFRYPTACSICLYVAIHLCMVLERLLATVKAASYESRHECVGYLLAIWAVVVSLYATRFNMRNFQTDVSMAYCATANDQTIEQVVNGCYLLAVYEIFIICLYLSVYFVNKGTEQMRSFNVSTEYQAKENVIVLKLLGPLFVTNFLSLASFCFCMGLLLSMREEFQSKTLFSTLHTAIYTIPYYGLISPIILWISLRRNKRLRSDTTASLMVSSIKEQDVYFRKYHEIWN